MNMLTFEGVVEGGQIRLKTNIHLPDNTKVYVIVPRDVLQKSAFIHSPRLRHPQQLADFQMEVVEETPDASV